MSNDLGPYTQNLEQMLGDRGAYDGETDAYAVLYGIALDLLTECSALRTTEHNFRSELEKVRKDAERYRWLRDDAYGYFWINHGGCYPRRGLDAAIDAAMKGKE